MKRSMKKSARISLIAVLILMLLACMGMSVRCFKKPAQIEQEGPAYPYQLEAQVDYQVIFTPNSFFPEPSAGPGRAYLTQLTEYIDTILSYNCQGDNNVEISGNYEAAAVLTGYIIKEKSDQKEKIKVWERSDPLIASTPFSSRESKEGLKANVPIDLRQYTLFADQVARDLKFTADAVELAIIYNITSQIKSPQGETSETIAPVLVIPIKGNAFTVEGALSQQKEGAINISQMVEAPGVMTSRMASSAVSVVVLLILLWVLFKTSTRIEDLVEKQLALIIKKYGDRIVSAAGKVPMISRENLLRLSSFADLVTVADEIGQPILYETLTRGIHSFYVISPPLAYSYVLEDMLPGQIEFNLESKAKDIPL